MRSRKIASQLTPSGIGSGAGVIGTSNGITYSLFFLAVVLVVTFGLAWWAGREP